MATAKKTVNTKNTEDTKAKVSDVVTYGNPDTWQLICKASSEKEGWMKSTKAMQTRLGCIVQVTTQQDDNIAESLVFVPSLRIQKDKEGNLFLG